MGVPAEATEPCGPGRGLSTGSMEVGVGEGSRVSRLVALGPPVLRKMELLCTRAWEEPSPGGAGRGHWIRGRHVGLGSGPSRPGRRLEKPVGGWIQGRVFTESLQTPQLCSMLREGGRSALSWAPLCSQFSARFFGEIENIG